MPQLAAARGRGPLPCGRRAGSLHQDGQPPTGCSSEGWEAGMDMESSRTDRARAGAGLPPHRWTKVDDPQSEAVIAAHSTVIAGGGPAGLTAAYELTRNGRSCVVLEADPNLVGGISRTDQYKGYRFDIGGHR